MNREIRKDAKKRYGDMLKEFSERKVHKGEMNCYTCSKCGRLTKTIDRDSGITPMGIECPFCGENAMGSAYIDLKPDEKPTFEWYRPTFEETLNLIDKHYFTYRYVLGGGLLRREIK